MRVPLLPLLKQEFSLEMFLPVYIQFFYLGLDRYRIPEPVDSRLHSPRLDLALTLIDLLLI